MVVYFKAIPSSSEVELYEKVWDILGAIPHNQTTRVGRGEPTDDPLVQLIRKTLFEVCRGSVSDQEAIYSAHGGKLGPGHFAVGSFDPTGTIVVIEQPTNGNFHRVPKSEMESACLALKKKEIAFEVSVYVPFGIENLRALDKVDDEEYDALLARISEESEKNFVGIFVPSMSKDRFVHFLNNIKGESHG